MAYELICTETGETQAICSSGTGVDPQDKSVGKALTYAHKYALIETFMLEIGDDPDATHSQEYEKSNGTNKKRNF